MGWLVVLFLNLVCQFFLSSLRDQFSCKNSTIIMKSLSNWYIWMCFVGRSWVLHSPICLALTFCWRVAYQFKLILVSWWWTFMKLIPSLIRGLIWLFYRYRTQLKIGISIWFDLILSFSFRNEITKIRFLLLIIEMEIFDFGICWITWQLHNWICLGFQILKHYWFVCCIV